MSKTKINNFIIKFLDNFDKSYTIINKWNEKNNQCLFSKLFSTDKLIKVLIPEKKNRRSKKENRK